MNKRGILTSNGIVESCLTARESRWLWFGRAMWSVGGGCEEGALGSWF